MARHDVARDDGVHVLAEMCPTCIFRPGNLMQLKSGRVRGMTDDSIRNGGCIPCHSTYGPAPAICRGFFDRHAGDVLALRLAIVFDRIVEDAVPD